MTTKLYKIKKLQWKESLTGHVTYTPFGRMEVYKNFGKWSWGYCFDEYYDEEYFPCGNLDEGKMAAQEEWEKRITSMMEIQNYDLL